MDPDIRVVLAFLLTLAILGSIQILTLGAIRNTAVDAHLTLLRIENLVQSIQTRVILRTSTSELEPAPVQSCCRMNWEDWGALHHRIGRSLPSPMIEVYPTTTWTDFSTQEETRDAK